MTETKPSKGQSWDYLRKKSVIVLTITPPQKNVSVTPGGYK
jgi:hypothetical protein